jgi:hypothetical protein
VRLTIALTVTFRKWLRKETNVGGCSAEGCECLRQLPELPQLT